MEVDQSYGIKMSQAGFSVVFLFKQKPNKKLCFAEEGEPFVLLYFCFSEDRTINIFLSPLA